MSVDAIRRRKEESSRAGPLAEAVLELDESVRALRERVFLLEEAELTRRHEALRKEEARERVVACPFCGTRL